MEDLKSPIFNESFDEEMFTLKDLKMNQYMNLILKR